MTDLFLGRQDGPLTAKQLSALRAQACVAEYGHMRPVTGDVMLALLDEIKCIRAALAQAVDVMRRSDADYCAAHQVAQVTDAEWDAALEAAEDAMEGGDGQG